ncbi:MAG: hypothetical protein A3D52_01135 [Candidatus Taylorbacteria bacterium RIFCSPHIGHO2_02_FULL_44_36]|uniref:DUF378 domain-containing protein n=1 Tax=Candidatus Taylorbacteria bacterium RIFCSPLOWO2_12_FULL_44_15c TaxID=1802333 RepID=A0A1G2P4M0_9BACT|nr:MAG: hypothetical protein A3D52_01135 [Candidatus Taylorbacteria bacterium RIFCSPHIGHO2_02_FULL_44_36]OHA38175.1 MAG: hypothetical protein A3I97_02075 [Candidatus Taylorbacteria bacterium RIFCSPLOWO2_02_FULL_44_35]OHA43307.1 MAG: hypothetical protein A3G03_01385 [Candidatus Taylorbacteria bacterium RIFCSPLOWO2_12_FULL_44_15c]
MKNLHLVAWILLVVGGLNWLLVGLGGSGWDLVSYLGGTLSSLVYILVGLSAVYEIATHKKNCKNCEKSTSPAQ